MSVITIGEVIKRVLEKEGIKYVFGVPGDQPYPLLNAFYGSNIKFITFHHEATAAHAADAYARVTGEIGVVLGTVGPGAANLIGGVYPAFAEGIPMLVLTAQNQVNRSYPDKGSMQALDQYSLFKAVTKWNAVIYSWDRVIEIMRRAISVAYSGRPGPVQVDIPSDILHKNIDEADLIIPERSVLESIGRPSPPMKSIEKIAQILATSERPLIHPGGGLMRSGGSEELQIISEYLQIPVVTSISGRGALPEDSPLSLIPNSYGALAAQTEADVVLVIGSKLGDLDFFGRPPIWGEYDKQKFIQVDTLPENIGLNRPVEIGIVADARETLILLSDVIRSKYPPVSKRERNNFYKEYERQWLDQFSEQSRSNEVPMHPLRVISEVRKFYARDSISVIDGGNTAVWAHYANRIYKPNSFLSTTSGDSGHLGSGIGFSIGAKLARPDKDVYCITGDGAFSMHIGDLETAKRLGLQVTFIVLNDSAWGMIKSGQTLYYNGNHIGVDFEDINYAEIAKAMGCFGERIKRPEDITDALKRAKKSNLPAVLDCEINKEVIPPDFQTLASIWLEGCDPPPKAAEKNMEQMAKENS